MKKMIKRIQLLFLLSFLTMVSFGQDEDIRLTASGPGVVEAGEYFRLSYSVNARGSEFNGPRLDNFQFSGPMLSTSMSTQIINGKVSQTSTYTYNYTVQATREGKYTIPPATVVVDGKKYTSNSLNIEVVKGSGNPQQQNNAGRAATNQPAQGTIGDSDLFVRINVDRNNVYKGEQILATIKVYTRVSLARFGDIKIPSFNGFWSQEIQVPDQVSLVRENIDGAIYNVGTIKKSILVPQQTGEITIEPFELECFVNIRNNSRSIFDDFFGSSQTVRKNLVSPEVKIQVRPLPTNAPQGFTGAVGSFSFDASLDKTSVKTNEAVNLKVRINGKGNFKLINPPDVEFPVDFETYEPKVSDNTSVSENGITGSRTMEYLLIPRYPGNFEIPALKFVYFDPQAGEYKTLRSQPFNIMVVQGEENETGTIIAGPGREDVRYLGADIRYINTGNTKLRQVKESLLIKPVFYLSYLVVAIIVLIVFMLLQNWQKKRSDTAGMRIRKAGRQSQHRLKQAGRRLKENNKEEFLNEVLKAIWGYLGDKLNLDQAKLNREFIQMFLASRNVDPAAIETLISLLDQCEYIRYAPGDSAAEMDTIFREAHEVINKLEQELRRSRRS
jgi:hypothetical protein